jgi:hypothetical protein
MTQSQPVRRVVDLLADAGYRQRETPVTVSSVPFEFSALFVGSDRSLDLIVVIDTLTELETRVRQKVEGLSRALDLVASRRPLTVVLVGPPPRAVIVAALSRVCRVLQVGTPTGSDAELSLRNSLAVLLPLELADASEIVADPFGEVRRYLQYAQHEEAVAEILASALEGTETVKQTLRTLLSEPFHVTPEADDE